MTFDMRFREVIQLEAPAFGFNFSQSFLRQEVNYECLCQATQNHVPIAQHLALVLGGNFAGEKLFQIHPVLIFSDTLLFAVRFDKRNKVQLSHNLSVGAMVSQLLIQSRLYH